MPEDSRFGKYELNARLSSGGMAITYRATMLGSHGVKKPVVLKLIHPHLADDPQFAALFIQEARLSAQLTHGNIAQVFDFGEVDGTYFIAMELVEGHSLADVIKHSRRRGSPILPEPLVMQIAIEMCEALHYAHTRTGENGQPLGVVHRDVSPENVMLSSSGEVKLLDFGIAKSAHNKLRTETGMVRGKYPYFSPEQARADLLDARTDVWATGVCMYEMLCQRRPYEGEFVDVMRGLVDGDFPLPSSLNPGLSHALEVIILKTLAYEREARYRTARDLGQALTERLHAEHPHAHRSDLQWLLQTLFGPDAPRFAEILRKRYPNRRELATPAQVRPSAPRGRDTVAQPEPVPTHLVKGPGATFETSTTSEDLPVVGDGKTDSTFRELQPVSSDPPAEEPGEPSTDRSVPPLRVRRRPDATLDTPELKKKRDRFVRIAVGAVGVLIIGVLVLAWKINQPKEEPEPMTPVWVSSTPAGAKVMLDGREVGLTPFQGFVPFGPHTFGMALAGYRPWSKRLTLQSTWQVPVDAKLVPEHADEPVEAQHPHVDICGTTPRWEHTA